MKRDRSDWLDYLLATGDWQQIRKLRKGFSPKQGRLRNTAGRLVSREERADTLAEYFATVQWAVRPVQAMTNTSLLGTPLPILQDSITETEVVKAAKKLRWNRASGPDELPPEFWKSITCSGSSACQWAVLLCQRCWEGVQVPDAWHESLVTAIFKKGDTSQCSNYRPISLLPIGYNYSP